MPTREEMIAHLTNANPQPTREQMVAHLTGGFPKEESTDTPAWKEALSGAARVLDYPGGIARTAVAGLANIPYAAATGKSITQPEDIVNALKGQGPTSAQYMERAGVPEGDVVDYPLVGKVSTRGLGGVALDIATDPLTALSKAGVAANGLDQAVEAGGKTLYKSGLKKIDQAVAEKGAQPFSDLMLENGVTGSSKSIQGASEQLLRDTKKSRDIIHEALDTAGAKVDPQIALKDAIDEATRVGAADPGMKSQMDLIQEKLQKYLDHGPVPVSQASEWKTNLYTAMPESAYDKFGKLKGPAQRIEKLAAGGLKNEIEASADAVAPGLGGQISQANQNMQTLLAARKPLKQAAKSAQSINAVTPVDAMLGGMGAAVSHDPLTTVGLLAAKKALDVSKTTGFRTMAGNAAMGLGQTGGVTPAANRLIMQSPWLKVKPKNQGE